MSQLRKINDAQFIAEVLNDTGLVVIEFGATWCGPCKKLHPVMDELAGELPNIKILEMDVGESPKTAQEQGVISVPQVLIFKHGRVVDRIVGVLPKAKLKERIESHQA